ncbi:MAG: GEVED domain-containing protein [Bacteroidales bacterium]
MKKILIILLNLFVGTISLNAQYSTDWIRPADNYQKTGSMIARDNSDNVIVTGYIQSQNIYTRKYDKFGNLLWEKTSTSGIQSNYEKPLWVNTDLNNNVFVVGYRYTFSSSRDYPSAIVVLKYNAAGTLLWKKNISLSVLVNSSLSFNLRSEVDNAGNLFIATVATTPSGFVLIKLNASGTTVFTKNNNLNGVSSFRSMRLKGSRVVLSGSAGNLSAAPVIAWDVNGNLLWTKSLTGQAGIDIELDASNNVYVLTSYANQVSATSGQDILIYKLNSSGTQVWKKNFDFGGNDFPTKFTLVSDKLSVIGAGTVNASYFDWLTFQVNTSGTKLWGTRYNGTTGNDEQPYFLAAKANGEVYVTGKGGPMFTQSNGSSYLRMITLKYNNAGAMKWRDTLNIYSGWGIACTLASDSSLFVLSGTNMTAFHFLDQSGTAPCTIPVGLSAGNITTTGATFSCTPVTGATLYHFRYKTIAATTWTIASSNLPTINLNGLSGGTSYNYAVEAVCSSGPSGYGASQTFSTIGAGYCTTGGLSTSQEFLNLVWIGGVINQTMSNNGYADFTNLVATITQGATMYGYLSPGTTPYGLMENYSIWIDYNHDNDFADAGEKVVNFSSDLGGYIGINFTVPTTALPGTTRMRITIQNGSAPAPCGMYARGETEDYSVVIASAAKQGSFQANAANSIGNSDEIIISPNPFQDKLSIQLQNAETPVKISVYDVTGKLQYSTQSSALQNDLNLSELRTGVYFIILMKEGKLVKKMKVIKK